jgi:hypothetical protein
MHPQASRCALRLHAQQRPRTHGRETRGERGDGGGRWWWWRQRRWGWSRRRWRRGRTRRRRRSGRTTRFSTRTPQGPSRLTPDRRTVAHHLGQRKILELFLRRRTPRPLSPSGRVPPEPTSDANLLVGAVPLPVARLVAAEAEAIHLRRDRATACRHIVFFEGLGFS